MKNYLDKTSVKFRKTLFEIIQNCGRGHLGATLSLFEILRVLYMDICKINSKNYQNKDKDIIILSKGHGCLAQYIILEKQGILKKKDLNNFCKFNALLGGHTDHKVPGVRFSTGSLGHGISMGMGLALSKKIKKEKIQVFVIIGDGELNEGSNWEAFLSISKNKLGNLNIIIDNNKIQSAGFTKDVLNMHPLKRKLESFNFKVYECDGHNISKLKNVLKQMKTYFVKSKILIANTVKGKGIKTIENNPKWHHLSEYIESKHKQILNDGINYYSEKL